ncbi:translation initiation factor IF-2-like [Mustela putorius furo]|uniref:Translation initiation factor IF-2-like n=1 Tax=Mustela putorius furo TaxID=9669 RepID=A0A8U0V4M2_MUSPF|nr:translation initiation factor IF-2-like [Mustela putorius furo]
MYLPRLTHFLPCVARSQQGQGQVWGVVGTTKKGDRTQQLVQGPLPGETWAMGPRAKGRGGQVLGHPPSMRKEQAPRGFPPAPPPPAKHQGTQGTSTRTARRGRRVAPLPTAAQRPWRGAATLAPGGFGGWWSLGENGTLLPTGRPPHQRRMGDPQRVFKPPRWDALGTWTGGGGTGEAGEGTRGHPALKPIPSEANPAGHGNPDAAGLASGGELYPLPYQAPQSSLLPTTSSLPAHANPGPSRHRRRGGCSGKRGTGRQGARSGWREHGQGRRGAEPGPEAWAWSRRGETRSGERQGQSRRPTGPRENRPGRAAGGGAPRAPRVSRGSEDPRGGGPARTTPGRRHGGPPPRRASADAPRAPCGRGDREGPAPRAKAAAAAARARAPLQALDPPSAEKARRGRTETWDKAGSLDISFHHQDYHNDLGCDSL